MKQNEQSDLVKQYRRGTFWNMMGSGMMAANTVVLSMLVGHFFDLNQVGMFSLSLTTSQVLYALALFGANDLQMTDYHHRFRFSHYFWVKVFSTILAVAGCLAAIGVFRIEGAARSYTILLTGFMLVNSLAELYQSMFFQCHRLDLSGMALFYRYFLATVAFLLALIFMKSIIIACVWMLAVDVAVTLWWVWRYTKQFRDSGYALELSQTICLTKTALPLCLSVLGSLVIVNSPKYLINAYLSDEIQGAYSILFMPTYAINLFSQFAFKPFFPRYSEALRGKKKAFGRLFACHAAVIGVLALGGGIVMWLLGVPLLRLFFGQNLQEYRGMMFLFVLSGGVLALNQLLYYIMVILGKQNLILGIYLLGLLFTLLSGVMLVPRHSINGAWLSFTIGQACLLTGYLFVLYRYIHREETGKKHEK